MKKIIALVLVCFMAFAAVACGDETANESSTPTFQTSSEAEVDSSTADTSKEESTPATESSDAAASEDESSEPATSTEDSAATSGDESAEDSSVEGETSTDEPGTVVYTNKYISWKNEYTNTARVPLRATDATSLQLSKINEEVEDGDTGIFTSEFGKNISVDGQDYADFAIVVAEYDHTMFSYKLKTFYEAGKAPDDVKIPADGYVLAIWKENTDKINALKALDAAKYPLYPHGVTINDGLDAKIDAAKTAPTIDGQVSSKEYGDVVWEIEPDNKLVSYVQFEVNNYYATAEVYMTYDADYFYLGVIVDSPYHYNVLGQESAGMMYDYECIQVNFGKNASDSDYILENWDHAINQTAATENQLNQYGFGVNDKGETIYCTWMPNNGTLVDTCMVVRDEENKRTVYEAAIPWAILGSAEDPFAPEKGDDIQVSISVNCGSEDSKFKNITLRDGGGIIGINDWTKIPTITLD
ncbi:MAG: hypothetical protein IKY21_02685 [Clostridia bacterium]|nr:hypothetical protein [Clostridia bacterium]